MPVANPLPTLQVNGCAGKLARDAKRVCRFLFGTNIVRCSTGGFSLNHVNCKVVRGSLPCVNLALNAAVSPPKRWFQFQLDGFFRYGTAPSTRTSHLLQLSRTKKTRLHQRVQGSLNLICLSMQRL